MEFALVMHGILLLEHIISSVYVKAIYVKFGTAHSFSQKYKLNYARNLCTFINKICVKCQRSALDFYATCLGFDARTGYKKQFSFCEI